MARPTRAETDAAGIDNHELLEVLVTGQSFDGSPWSLPVESTKDTAAQPGTSVPVGNTSTFVIAANPDRAELTLVNDSADPIYLRLASTDAALNSGIRLNAAGGSYTTTHYRGAVSAIQADGLATRRLLVAEV